MQETARRLGQALLDKDQDEARKADQKESKEKRDRIEMMNTSMRMYKEEAVHKKDREAAVQDLEKAQKIRDKVTRKLDLKAYWPRGKVRFQ